MLSKAQKRFSKKSTSHPYKVPGNHKLTKLLILATHLQGWNYYLHLTYMETKFRETKPSPEPHNNEGAVLGSEPLSIDFKVFLLHYMTARMQGQALSQGWDGSGLLFSSQAHLGSLLAIE